MITTVIVNTHSDFTGEMNDVEKYKARATDILSSQWDVVEFEDVPAQRSWRYDGLDEQIDRDLLDWTQESLERAYQESEA